MPGWRTTIAEDSESMPESFQTFVYKLALENTRRINAAAVANPSSLAAVALLASPQRVVAHEELVEQIGYLVWLLKGQPYSDYLYIPETSPKTLVELSDTIGQIARMPPPCAELPAVPPRRDLA